MSILDVFGIKEIGGGVYAVTKNGEHFLKCYGGKDAAQHIADLLNADAEKVREKNGNV